MSHRWVFAAGLALVTLQTHALAVGADSPLPIRNGSPVVATVNRDTISLDEFMLQEVAPASRTRLRRGLATADELALLDRMINVKLIAQEADRMGLGEAPQIRKQAEVQSREILRELLMQHIVRNVRPDPAAVEKLYRDSVREWKTASVLFQDQAAADRARKDIGNGEAFAAVVAKAVADKTAKAEADPAFHSTTDFLPPIGEAVAKLRVGQVSPVIRLPSGFVLVKVVGIRYPRNAQARAQARSSVRRQQELAVLKAHDEALRRQYVVVHKDVLQAIDYEAARPGYKALLEDKRVVADIKGAQPITVGDLTDYLRLQFFHGADQVRQYKEMNAKKAEALEATLGRRLLNVEAAKLGLHRTTAYRDRVNGYRESLVFDSFIQKVIVPENKMREEEVKGYYGGHVKEYSTPEMFKVRSLAFSQRTAAEKAIRRLREGTDYAWLAANADGQAPQNTDGLLTFDGRPLMTESMPPGVRNALSGSKAGDLRLYASPEGPFYVLSVQQVIPPAAKPYDEVRQDIARKLYGEKLKKSVADYAAKLRAHSKVATYLKKVR